MVLSTTSRHILSFDPASDDIEAKVLLQVLQESLSEQLQAPPSSDPDDDATTPLTTPRKRKKHPTPEKKGKEKRAKVTDVVEEGVEVEEEAVEGESETWEVLHHVFELQCTRSQPGKTSKSTKDKQWKVVQYLNEVVENMSEDTEDIRKRTIRNVKISKIAGELWLMVDDKAHAFMKVPPLRCADSDDAYDYRNGVLANLVAAGYELWQDGRVDLACSLAVVFLPQALIDTSRNELPFRFIIQVDMSIVTPKIFEPIVRVGATLSWNRVNMLEECQRRLLSHIFRPAPETILDHHDDADIPFFFSCLGPAPAFPSPQAQSAAQPDGLQSTLLPFQRRSVGWLLKREGKHITESGEIVEKPVSPNAVPMFWEKVSISNADKEYYFQRLTGVISPMLPQPDDYKGGILAEEPGMGKTLECISLMLLNPGVSRNPKNMRWDPEARVNVKEIKTTLIVTPASLAQQWVDEMALHAPELKVLVYDGWQKVPVPITITEDDEENKSGKARSKAKAKSRNKIAAQRHLARLSSSSRVPNFAMSGSSKIKRPRDSEDELDETDDEEPEDWASYVNQFDVCITTYNVLQLDLGVARAPVQRPRRDVGRYSTIDRPRSPLILCEWYRVIMDEVQMVGGGKTQEMVSLIPRLSSLAVSGTPARASVADLIHVLRFLRVTSLTETPRLWHRLLKPGFAFQFQTLFKQIAIRTLKSGVKDELTIPEQKRYVVPIQLGRVERHIYDQNLEQALSELGLDARGIAASDGWQVDVGLLRSWLRRLRGICIHPQVGSLQKPSNDKWQKRGGLKTIGEVLESMKDTNWRDLMDALKTKILAVITQARLLQQVRSNESRHVESHKLLLTAQKQVASLVQEIKEEIAEHNRKGDILRQEAAARRKERSGDQEDVAPSSQPRADVKGKGKGKQDDYESDDLSDADTEDSDGLPKTPAGAEHLFKKSALQNRLRETLIVVHQVHFLLGDVYHNLGNSSDSEDAEYAAAENVRKELLKTTETAANRSMTGLKRSAGRKAVTDKELQIDHCGKGGIKSEELLREADRIIDVLNQQSKLLLKWRARIFNLLTAPLAAGDGDEVDGQEYARTLETQGEAETYLQAYAALLASRKEVMNAERTALAVANAKEAKTRKTHAASRAIASNEEASLLEAADLQPEHEALQAELNTQMKEIREGYKGRAIKSVMVDLSSVAASIASENDPEKIIAKDWAKQLRRLLSEQTSLMDKLESDLAPYRKAFNDRILYFRQLQELSDSVADPTWEGRLEEALKQANEEEKKLEIKINESRARQRYLSHMTKAQDEEDEDEGVCILCRCEFTRGFITHCAHVYCDGCLKAWLARGQGKVCPVCRVIIDADQLQRITLSENKRIEQLEAPRDVNAKTVGPVPKTRRVIRYNTIKPELFDEIENTEAHGSYGSKIETLVRHLLYLQEKEPDAKSIVFSAWADSLHIIQHALTANGIPSLKIEQSGRQKSSANRFRNDPSILVLLLHGERENAGLNVTCASRVFMVESVVQHAFEIQAIARIDRMGQTRPTEVYCYYAEDTVERNILDLAAKQGLSLYTEENASGSLNVTSLTVDANKQIDSPSRKAKQKGDFIFRADDMLAILFPHMFEDLEYLLPSEDSPGDAMVIDSEPVAGPSGSRR